MGNMEASLVLCKKAWGGYSKYLHESVVQWVCSCILGLLGNDMQLVMAMPLIITSRTVCINHVTVKGLFHTLRKIFKIWLRNPNSNAKVQCIAATWPSLTTAQFS